MNITFLGINTKTGRYSMIINDEHSIEIDAAQHAKLVNCLPTYIKQEDVLTSAESFYVEKEEVDTEQDDAEEYSEIEEQEIDDE